MEVREYTKYFVVSDFVLDYQGPKPETTLDALNMSIAKWHIVSTSDPLIIMDGAISTCGLCRLYYNDCCESCPVSYNTGISCCRDTPCERFYDWRYTDEKVARTAATAEYRYLLKLKKEFLSRI